MADTTAPLPPKPQNDSAAREPLPVMGAAWKVIARAVRLLSPPIRRRLLTAVGASAVMAVLEAASFALLFFLIKVLSDVNAPLPGLAKAFGAAQSRDSFLARCGALVLALFLAKSLGSFILLRIQSSLLALTDGYLSTALFSRYLATPYLQFIQRNSAEMIMNVQHRTIDVATNSVGAVITLASETAVLVGVVVTLAIVQPVLAAGVFIFLGIVATGLLKVLTPAIRKSGYAESAEGTKAQRLMQESMGGIKAIKANELASQFVDRFSEQRTTLAELRRRRVLLTRLPQFYLENALFLGLGVLAVIVFRTSSANIIPIFGVLVAAAFRILPSLSRIIGSLSAVRGSEASVRYVEDDLRRAPLPAPRRDTTPPVELNDRLSLRNVGFQYPKSILEALSAITIDIAAGESIGLVGASGAGKTTFVDIVLGLLYPTRGELFVDGEPLNDQRLPAWRHTIGYVPQDVFLLDATLRENIIFGRPDLDDHRLAEAVKLAQLDDVVAGLPMGLETAVGERGVRLSGGQRQRIGIARALVTRPSLLILDEATAALDTRTEAAITASIDALHGRTTTIVIAHRLSTVQHCDRIVFLDEGRVRAVDSFENLQRNDPEFEELVRLGQLGPGREVRGGRSHSR